MKDKFFCGMIGFLLATTIFCAIGWAESSSEASSMAEDIKAIRTALCPVAEDKEFEIRTLHPWRQPFYYQLLQIRKKSEEIAADAQKTRRAIISDTFADIIGVGHPSIWERICR